MSREKTIHILVVDNYSVVRQGLQALIDTAPDMLVVGEATNGFMAIQQARNLHPDVVVMELVMPGLDGIETIKAIREELPEARILVLTNSGDEHRVLAALGAGAGGYLLKDAVLTDVIEAIRDVHHGKLTLHPSIAEVLLHAVQATQARNLEL
jgi:NarL family two-component system response regulator LiaR